MSEFETKPNKGRAWETTQDMKMESHQRLTQYDWYNGLANEEKQEKIPMWHGYIDVQIDGVLTKLGIEICRNTTREGKPQMMLSTWVKKPAGQGSSAGRSSTEQNADPFADIFK